MIRLSTSFVRSRFARRIFLLFVSSAIVPVAVAAFLSLSHVSKQLREHSYEQSRQTSKAVGMQLFERLALLRTEFAALAEVLQLSPQLPSRSPLPGDQDLSPRLTALATVSAAGELTSLVGTIDQSPALSDTQNRHLMRGGTVLYAQANGDETTDLLLVRQLDANDPARGQLVGKIQPGFLWNVEDTLSASTAMIALSPSGTVVYRSVGFPAPPLSTLKTQLATSTTGHFAWDSGATTYLASYWSLFTEAEFAFPYLAIVVSQSETNALAPIINFRTVYVPALILVVLSVSFVAATQIRRKLAPLVTLSDATQRIAGGDFSGRVRLAGDDEFTELGDAFNAMADRLGRQFTSLSTMAEIDRMILSSFDTRYIISTVLDRAGELTSCSVAAMLELNDEHTGAGYLSVRINGPQAEISRERAQLLSDDIRTLNEHPHSLLITCDRPWPAYLAPLRVADARSLLLLPVFIKQQLAAVMIFGFGEACESCERESGPLRKFADHVTVALSNASWEERLYHQAHYDTLTNLPNRALLKDRLEQAIARARRNGSYVGVAFLDLDRFKLVNDSLGHSTGDLLLKETAGLLLGSVRSVDTVVRFGGDEFVVIIPDIDRDQDIGFELGAIADKLLDSTRQELVLGSRRVHTELSIGIALYPRDGETPDDLVKNADTAMYHAKEQGRGNYQFYSAELNAAASSRLSLEHELHRALKNHEFELYYQAKVESTSGRLIGAEALLRWRHPERGIVLPGEFIGIAEETGLIQGIGEWAARTACQQIRTWQEAGLPAIRVGVNVSPRQFWEGDLAARIGQILASARLGPEALELEVTEGMVMEDRNDSIETLKRLSAMGIRLLIDDFGTGYSSLSYLRKLPIHALKIDQSFVRDMLNDPDAQAIVSATIVLGHRLGLDVIAEGVATHGQRRLLQRWGCDELQGYLISKPLDTDAFTRLLMQHQTQALSEDASRDTRLSLSPKRT